MTDLDVVAAVGLDSDGGGSVSLTVYGQVTIETCCDTIGSVSDDELDKLVGLLLRAQSIRKGVSTRPPPAYPEPRRLPDDPPPGSP